MTFECATAYCKLDVPEAFSADIVVNHDICSTMNAAVTCWRILNLS